MAVDFNDGFNKSLAIFFFFFWKGIQSQVIRTFATATVRASIRVQPSRFFFGFIRFQIKIDAIHLRLDFEFFPVPPRIKGRIKSKGENAVLLRLSDYEKKASRVNNVGQDMTVA